MSVQPLKMIGTFSNKREHKREFAQKEPVCLCLAFKKCYLHNETFLEVVPCYRSNHSVSWPSQLLVFFSLIEWYLPVSPATPEHAQLSSYPPIPSPLFETQVCSLNTLGMNKATPLTPVLYIEN
jgi:hypothetical protein